jgi:hypothetical protein
MRAVCRYQVLLTSRTRRQSNSRPLTRHHWRSRCVTSNYDVWLHRFREGNTSCEDRSRSRRPLTVLQDSVLKLLLKYPFASAKNIAIHFGISLSTVKGPLMREPGLRNGLKDGPIGASRLPAKVASCHMQNRDSVAREEVDNAPRARLTRNLLCKDLLLVEIPRPACRAWKRTYPTAECQSPFITNRDR